MDKMWRVTKQLLREFWIPLLAALAFTAYRYAETPQASRGSFSFLDAFGARIFFFSWLAGQVFRVAKQHAVEDTLSKIDHRVSDSLNQLETRTDKILRTMTGGDSQCRLLLHPSGDSFTAFLIVSGADPMVQVSLTVTRILDFKYDEQNPSSNSYRLTAPPLVSAIYPVLHPGQIVQEVFAPNVPGDLALHVRLNSMNKARQFVFLFKHFPDAPMKWIWRQLEWVSQSEVRVSNSFCTEGPWETARPLTVQELNASYSLPSSNSGA